MSQSPTLTDDVRDRLLSVSVPTVVSTLWRKGFKNTLLFGPQPLNARATKFVGPAFTVRTIAVREDLLDAQERGERPNLQAQAVADIAAGEVLAVAMGGQTRTAFMGDIMTTHLKVKGAAGVVLDGAVSDAVAIAQIQLPVFCVGTAATPLSSHRLVVELNGSIECAGVTILPGDILMGDGNGVVVIPRQLAAEISETCTEREILEEFIVERVGAGAPLAGTYPPDDVTLQAFQRWRAERQK